MMFMGQSVEQLCRLIDHGSSVKHNAVRSGFLDVARKVEHEVAGYKVQRNLMQARVCAEVNALRRMGGGRNRKLAQSQNEKFVLRRLLYPVKVAAVGLMGASHLSLAIHKQHIGRIARVATPSPVVQRRIDRLEAWKASQGVHAAFNGKMTAGYWVGEARKIMSRLIRDRKSGLYHTVNDARWQRYMQYARIALHGFVWSFHYHGRFVGYITAMSLEAATRCAEDQALQFSPTAPIEQIRSGVQLKRA